MGIECSSLLDLLRAEDASQGEILTSTYAGVKPTEEFRDSCHAGKGILRVYKVPEGDIKYSLGKHRYLWNGSKFTYQSNLSSLSRDAKYDL